MRKLKETIANMKRVFLLGAGASKSYDDSKTGVKMPISSDFFNAFHQLKLAQNPWVLFGDIINYVAKKNNSDILDFLFYNEDIEALHTEIQEKLYKRLNSGNFTLHIDDTHLLKSYNQLIFLFVSVINEIQNGPISQSHINLAKQLDDNDCIITFNWDTLMDRALNQETSWNSDFGYLVKPVAVYRDKWVSIDLNNENSNFPKLLKLHGSSNWLTSHNMPKDGRLELMQETEPENFFVYENTNSPYDCYEGRYMKNYEEFSYGYYPPNLPLKGKQVPDEMLLFKHRLKSPFMPEGKAGRTGLVSMPLIIPPVKHKEYDSFGDLFGILWEEAKNQLIEANKIYIIGYSFPITDVRSNHLFKSVFKKRSFFPEIVILNPNPDEIVKRFEKEFLVPRDKLKVIKQYFTKDFDINANT